MSLNRPGSAAFELERILRGGTVAGLSDGELLERFASRRGEAAEIAFEAILSRHGPLVMSVCRSLLHDSHDAEDAFQATFLVLARKAGSIRVHSTLAGWLHGAARRVAMRARSRAERRKSRETGPPVETLVAAPIDDVDRRDLVEAIHREVGRLPEKYRVPILLCYFEGHSHESAAVLLGRPVGTIHGRLSRGRTILRRRLVRLGFAPSAGWLAATILGEAGPVKAATLAVVPTSLLHSTLRAASPFAAGETLAAASFVSASSITLSQGAIRAMIFSPFKIGLAGVAVFGFAAGAGLEGYQVFGSGGQEGKSVQAEADQPNSELPAAPVPSSSDDPKRPGPPGPDSQPTTPQVREGEMQVISVETSEGRIEPPSPSQRRPFPAGSPAPERASRGSVSISTNRKIPPPRITAPRPRGVSQLSPSPDQLPPPNRPPDPRQLPGPSPIDAPHAPLMTMEPFHGRFPEELDAQKSTPQTLMQYRQSKVENLQGVLRIQTERAKQLRQLLSIVELDLKATEAALKVIQSTEVEEMNPRTHGSPREGSTSKPRTLPEVRGGANPPNPAESQPSIEPSPENSASGPFAAPLGEDEEEPIVEPIDMPKEPFAGPHATIMVEVHGKIPSAPHGIFTVDDRGMIEPSKTFGPMHVAGLSAKEIKLLLINKLLERGVPETVLGLKVSRRSPSGDVREVRVPASEVETLQVMIGSPQSTAPSSNATPYSNAPGTGYRDGVEYGKRYGAPTSGGYAPADAKNAERAKKN